MCRPLHQQPQHVASKPGVGMGWVAQKLACLFLCPPQPGEPPWVAQHRQCTVETPNAKIVTTSLGCASGLSDLHSCTQVSITQLSITTCCHWLVTSASYCLCDQLTLQGLFGRRHKRTGSGCDHMDFGVVRCLTPAISCDMLHVAEPHGRATW